MQYPAFSSIPGLVAPFPLSLTVNASETVYDALGSLFASYALTSAEPPRVLGEWLLVELALNLHPHKLLKCLVNPPKFGFQLIFASPVSAQPLEPLDTDNFVPLLQKYRKVFTKNLKFSPKQTFRSCRVYFESLQAHQSTQQSLSVKTTLLSEFESAYTNTTYVTLKKGPTYQAGSTGLLGRTITGEHVSFELLSPFAKTIRFEKRPPFKVPSIPASFSSIQELLTYALLKHIPASFPSQRIFGPGHFSAEKPEVIDLFHTHYQKLYPTTEEERKKFALWLKTEYMKFADCQDAYKLVTFHHATLPVVLALVPTTHIVNDEINRATTIRVLTPPELAPELRRELFVWFNNFNQFGYITSLFSLYGSEDVVTCTYV